MIKTWIKIFVPLSAIAFFAVGAIALFNLQSLQPGEEVTNAAQTHATYMAGRQIVLALALVFLLLKKEWRSLGFLLIIMGLIQAFDTGIGLTHGVVDKTVGPLVLAVLNFAAAKSLLRDRIV